MATEIWMFPIGIDLRSFTMPRGAEPLSIGYQPEGLMLWARVDTTAPKVRRDVRIVGTGWEMSTAGRHVGTVQHNPTGLVWHVFDHGEIVDGPVSSEETQ
jgi:hypothetical protein